MRQPMELKQQERKIEDIGQKEMLLMYILLAPYDKRLLIKWFLQNLDLEMKQVLLKDFIKQEAK